MTPEAKMYANELLAPYDARVETDVPDAQDVRFIKVTTEGPSELPLNVLDSDELMLHTEQSTAAQVRQARRLGRPLLRIISVSHHDGTGMNVLSFEDLAAQRRDNTRPEPVRGSAGMASAPVPAKPKPNLPWGWGEAYPYPPNHPSVTGKRIV